jgi:hypothetical protein
MIFFKVKSMFFNQKITSWNQQAQFLQESYQQLEIFSDKQFKFLIVFKKTF